MEFRASLFANKWFGLFAATLCAVLFAALVASHTWLPALAVFVLAAAAIRRLNLRTITFFADTLHYDGWFHSFTVNLADIDQVVPASSLGYPAARLRGPASYRIVERGGRRRWVSLLLFGPAASRHFRDQILDPRERLRGAEPATFEVLEHFELTGRGVVLFGRILSGVFRVGMLASCAEEFAPLTITGVESVTSSTSITTGLVFEQHEGLAALRNQFPVGSVLTASLGQPA